MAVVRHVLWRRGGSVFDDARRLVSATRNDAVLNRARRCLGSGALVGTAGKRSDDLALCAEPGPVHRESSRLVWSRIQREPDHQRRLVQVLNSMLLRGRHLAGLGRGQPALDADFRPMRAADSFHSPAARDAVRAREWTRSLHLDHDRRQSVRREHALQSPADQRREWRLRRSLPIKRRRQFGSLFRVGTQPAVDVLVNSGDPQLPSCGFSSQVRCYKFRYNLMRYAVRFRLRGFLLRSLPAGVLRSRAASFATTAWT